MEGKRLLQHALDWVYPRRCALCGFWESGALCSVCESALAPFEAEEEASSPQLDERHAVFEYLGRARQAVHRLKFDRAVSLAEPMAERLARFAHAQLSFGYDLVVPVPIHWSRRCQRGFNQAELLAEAWPREIRDAKLLIRTRPTLPQAQLSAAERWSNLTGAFRTREALNGEAVLLIDDVITTGATATECAACLKAAGASKVAVLAFAGGEGRVQREIPSDVYND